MCMCGCWENQEACINITPLYARLCTIMCPVELHKRATQRHTCSHCSALPSKLRTHRPSLPLSSSPSFCSKSMAFHSDPGGQSTPLSHKATKASSRGLSSRRKSFLCETCIFCTLHTFTAWARGSFGGCAVRKSSVSQWSWASALVFTASSSANEGILTRLAPGAVSMKSTCLLTYFDCTTVGLKLQGGVSHAAQQPDEHK